MKLVIRFNGLVLQTVKLESGDYEIGRDPENQIQVNHPSLHRKHGKISSIQNKWVYQDYTTQKIQTIDDEGSIALSSQIDLATETYSMSEKTGDVDVRGLRQQRSHKIMLGFVVVAAVFVISIFAYMFLKNQSKHADPNRLLADVRSKVVEFEKIKDLAAVEDYKEYGGFSDTDFRENMGYCTGFFVAPNVVLTASHCLWGSDFLDLQTAFEIRTADGKKFQPQQILGFDPVRDFLFLKIEGAESYGYLEFADDFKIGQTVYTLGNAHGQGIAIREGIMANETQDLNDPTIKYIRYSAGASPGNSGGPLLDSQGRIVALVFAATGAENYNLGTSCHDLKVGFKKFVENTEPKEIKIKVKKLFNFNLNSFLQKQILPFLAEYSEYPEVNELIDQIELKFESPIPFELIGEKILTEVQQKSSLALKSVEEALLAKKQVVLDWRSFLSEKTPAIFPSQFDSSQNSFYKHDGRLYMKVAGFLDSPNRKDFRAYVEQFEKEKKFDFQAYGMNIEFVPLSEPTSKDIQYVLKNTAKNKLSVDDLAHGSLYNQLLLNTKVTDPDITGKFLKNFFGEEGALSGTYSAFIRPQSYKTFTLKNFDKPMEKSEVEDGLGRRWHRWNFKIFDQIHFYIYCLPVPEGSHCAARIFPVENKDRRQFVEANFREHILGHFLENPYFWEPQELVTFLQQPENQKLTSLRGIELTKTNTKYSLKLKAFDLELLLPNTMKSLRLLTGLYQGKDLKADWVGFGAEWINGTSQMCGVLLEPANSQSLFILNFLRDTLKRQKLKEEAKKDEIPQYWTKNITTSKGDTVQLVGYCAPLKENPIEISTYFVDLKRAKPFTGTYKALK